MSKDETMFAEKVYRHDTVAMPAGHKPVHCLKTKKTVRQSADNLRRETIAVYPQLRDVEVE